MISVPLGDDLGIESAPDLKQRLAPHLGQPQPLLLDAGAVQQVHTASLQVLCTFVRQRQRSGRATSFADASDAFGDAVRVLGLSAQLGLANDPIQPEAENAA
ncbi:MAG TPA: STAS domain-containing protein [Pseudoxanthomonas sp.]|nr:STAS domain-containing protein [Pseudoxanthomonas sp.]